MSYLVSDIIMLILVCTSFFMCKGTLYSYAKFKFVVTTVLLAINLALLIYGMVIVGMLPTNFADPDMKE